jgi:transcription elongation factor Elf1
MSRARYRVDLGSVDKEGRFPCPRCGTEINPGVKNKEIYDISEIRMKGSIAYAAIIDCKKCGSEIELELLPKKEKQ